MEERIVIQARDGRASRLTCTAATQALGADLQRLEHVLDGGADEAPDAAVSAPGRRCGKIRPLPRCRCSPTAGACRCPLPSRVS
jgi:hypothetical protein